MSTRSNIVIRYADGTEKGIYCHSDGYINGVGAVLLEHYYTKDKVECLIGLGDLSCIGDYTNPNPELPHSWGNAQPNVCVAYHRDRGEDFRQSGHSNTFEDDLGIGIEYVYIFDEKTEEWVVKYYDYDTSLNDAVYRPEIVTRPLEQALVDANIREQILSLGGND